MKIHYRFTQLSRDEAEYLEIVLMNELEDQSWYSIYFSRIFDEELILTLQ